MPERKLNGPNFEMCILTVFFIFFSHLVDCIISKWSSCSQSCGPGTQNRTILVPAKNGGEECTGSLDRACNERNCPGKRLSKV